jgi:cold shock CspA family protein
MSTNLLGITAPPQGPWRPNEPSVEVQSLVTEPRKKRESGTVVVWWYNTGQIKADTGELLAVHQVDLQFQGAGVRRLPVGYQCEFERCRGPTGLPRACEVSQAAGRPWVFEAKSGPPSKESSLNPLWESKVPTLGSSIELRSEPHHLGQEQDNALQRKYQCVLELDPSLYKGVVKYFNSIELYACIQPDEDSDEEIFCDASSIVKDGSYMFVQRGTKVEYRKGSNALGECVATRCTGPEGKPINNTSIRVHLRAKRILGKAELEKRKRRKLMEIVEIPPPPEIPEGKNPVVIFHELVTTCKPKKIVAFKLVDQKRGRSAKTKKGVCTSFTFECILDNESIAKGIASTKKKAKMYAAQNGLDHLAASNPVYQAEIIRIRTGSRTRRRVMPHTISHRQQTYATAPSLLASTAQHVQQYNPYEQLSYAQQPTVQLYHAYYQAYAAQATAQAYYSAQIAQMGRQQQQRTISMPTVAPTSDNIVDAPPVAADIPATIVKDEEQMSLGYL